LKSNSQFDYVIIGGGVAGLHLAYQFSNKDFFSSKKIVIIEKSFSSHTDKTLSFWEKEPGLWDEVIFKSWSSTSFKSLSNNFKIELEPYIYKSLSFLDFRKHCREELSKFSNITFLEDEVISLVENQQKVTVNLLNSKIDASRVFDSRISKGYEVKKHNFPLIVQSFKGWVVVFDKEVFDDNSFTMMDYQYQWKDSNSFMYILPRSGKEALLEYTFFSSFVISSEDFDRQIQGYINTFFPNVKYTIIASEVGEIPMSAYPFKEGNSERIHKIGTAGGWVKASTGYSFKFAEKNAKLIAKQLINNETIFGYKQPKRFKFYDSLFIKVLQYQNKQGPRIFEMMYKRVKPEILFRFLDEETRFIEEIGIILKLPYMPFLKALFSKKDSLD